MQRPVPPSTPEWFTVDDSTLNVALVYPMQGPAGVFGPTCETCARLAAEEVNKAGGVLGKELRLLEVDGGAEPRQVAEDVEALVATGVVQGVTGWHISSVRQAMAPRIAHRVPYVYTALYEGGERTDGVYLTSETPASQLLPAIIAHERLSIANMVRAPKPKPDTENPGAFLPNGAAAKAGLNKSIHDAGWGVFLGILAHKAESAGRKLIPVDPRNTSRTCPACGHVSGENRTTQEKFECTQCGHTANADQVGALNVAVRAGLVLPDVA